MKLHISHLQISDFKGISGTHDIDLRSSVVFLNGANGYGKTTIYDALELALTGTIGRIEKGKGYEDGHKKHLSSVLHNDPAKDIVISLEITKDDITKTIIVRCPKVESRQPLVDWGKFETSLISDSGDAEGGRREIDNWLEITKDGYRLFTYLQQSDSTFFLKLAQKDRHAMLNPLLDASGKYAHELSAVESTRKRLTGYKNHLKIKLKAFDSDSISTEQEAIAHVRLVAEGIIQDYDHVEPFKNLGIENAKIRYASIIEKLNDLELFFDQFVPLEYTKREKYRYLIRFSKDQDYLDSVVLKNVVDSIELQELINKRLEVKRIAKDTDLLKKYYLRKLLEPIRFDALAQANFKYNLNKSALYKNDEEFYKIEEILAKIADPKFGFSISDRDLASGFRQEYYPIVMAVGTYGELVTELENARADLEKNFGQLTQHSAFAGHKANDCPMCGFHYNSADDLVNAINEKTKSVEQLMAGQIKRKDILEKRILNDFLNEHITALDKQESDASLFNLLRTFGALKMQDVNRNKLIEEIVPDVVGSVASEKNLEMGDVNIAARKLYDNINSHITDTEVKMLEHIKNLKSKDYSTYATVLSKLNVVFDEKDVLRGEEIPSRESVDMAVENLRSVLELTAEQITIKPEATLSEHIDLYKRLFNTDEEKFAASKELLPKKRQYVEQQFSLSYLNAKYALESKFSSVEKLLSKVEGLKDAYGIALRDYQHGITKALQLPFYVYSAKILQNTPQCQGVFMVTQSDSGTIVFTTEHGATHDVAGQLSSGQLVVVSMAFYLAINSVFTDYSTGLMAIDDPIQDLDSLNMHSLTELMRREFVDKYQVIMSTHSNLDVNYMKYKFSTAIGKENIVGIDVQKTFFGVVAPTN